MQNKHTLVRIQTEHGLAHIDVDRILAIHPPKWWSVTSRMEVISFAEPQMVNTVKFTGPAIFCFVGISGAFEGGDKNL